ncbi:hypothetical protein U1Q18_032386, partial [Sarracenia purpurea var. burkii]
CSWILTSAGLFPLLLSCPASVGVCVLLALDCFAPREHGPLPVAEVTAVGDAWPSAVLPLLLSCPAAGLCVLLALACFAPREHGSSPLLPNIFLMPMPSFCCHFAAGFWLVFAPREHGPLPVAEVTAVGAAWPSAGLPLLLSCPAAVLPCCWLVCDLEHFFLVCLCFCCNLVCLVVSML